MNWDAGDFDPEAHQSQVDEEAHRILTSDLGEGIRQELKKSLNRDAMVQALNVLLEDYGLEVAAPWDEFDESDEDDF